eukprot:898425-Amphidinium_carterae.1
MTQSPTLNCPTYISQRTFGVPSAISTLRFGSLTVIVNVDMSESLLHALLLWSSWAQSQCCLLFTY